MMHWDSWQVFFAMGGYAFYVWGSFGLSTLFVAWELWSVERRRLTAIRQIQQLQLLE